MTGGVFLPVRLPMYDWPEIRKSTRNLEEALQSALVKALDLEPSDLAASPTDTDLHTFWNHPDLLLGQTCGYPLTHALRGKVRPLGVPHYDAAGCQGVRYCSHLVVAADSPFETLADLPGKTAVYNSADSQSGMNAFRHRVAPLAAGASFFSSVIKSGSHLASLKLVAEGRADIASIDAVCWALACQELPELTAKLRSIGVTAAAPGLPLITSMKWSSSDADKMVETIRSVFSDPATAECRSRLRISGFSTVKPEDYDQILRMEQDAERLGYPDLI